MLKRIAKRAAASFGYEVRNTRRPGYPSETSKCRARLAPFCTGNGVDIGPGGDPILPTAVRVDLQSPYSHVGDNPVQLAGDATNLYWFADGVLDYAYSSHVLEDFVDTKSVLREWLRVLKPGGHLVVYCPDELRYRAHCRATGQPYNQAHKLENFSFDHVVSAITEVDPGGKIVHGHPAVELYSWELVWARSGSAKTES
jgi:predicted SAM-dependent methyltransferase